MNWDNIRFFLAVARAGSVAAAAREMGIKHTTILRRLDQLEADMQVKLFNRLTTGYSLTDAGHTILSQAEAMESNAFSISRQLRGVDNELEGGVVLTFPSDLRPTMTPWLAEFTDRFPGISLTIEVGSSEKNINLLESDVAIRETFSPPEALVGRQLGQVHFAAYVARKAYDPANQSLADYAWVVWGFSNNSQFEEWISTRFGVNSIALRTNDVYSACDLVSRGVGISFLPCHLAANYPELKRLDFDDAGYSLDLWLLTHPDFRGVARFKALMDFLAEKLVAWL